jgi:hypothetical protein
MREERERRARFVRRISRGCYRCHGCDSHKCSGTCAIAKGDRSSTPQHPLRPRPHGLRPPLGQPLRPRPRPHRDPPPATPALPPRRMSPPKNSPPLHSWNLLPVHAGPDEWRCALCGTETTFPENDLPPRYCVPRASRITPHPLPDPQPFTLTLSHV